ncbi:hypothetical protein HYW58_03140 [Candidatus Kaiserbacteria bacterium]|nr:hypothetical protein [Candidatus Kaiserbacteria bacterium]
MSSWSTRRRVMYISGILLFLLVVVGVPVFFVWYETPTCFDGVQNQAELEADRGGPCTLLHTSQVQNIGILWSRSFEVVPGVYNAVAYIDNPNFSAGAVDVPYSFKLFDNANLLVLERRGTTYFSPNSVVPIFEGGIETGERIPTRTFFEFLDRPEWERVLSPVEGLSVESRALRNEDDAPELNAVISNQSFQDISNIEVIATVFNADNIAIASSRTVIALLSGQSSESVTFTWPRPFRDSVSRIDIIPKAPFRE